MTLAEFVLFIVAVCDNLLSTLLVGTMLAAPVALAVRISQRKPFPAHIFDNLTDKIEPIIQKGAVVFAFACFCMWLGNKTINAFFDTYTELSCLPGLAGIALIVLLWRIWKR